MLAHFRQRQKERAENTWPLIFKSYPNLLPDHELDILKTIKNYMKNKQYEEVVSCF